MKPAHIAIAIAATAAAGLALIHRQAQQLEAEQLAGDAAGGELASSGEAAGIEYSTFDLVGRASAAIESYQVQQAIDNDTDNLAAFLAMIARSEGTDRASDQYRVCYGYRHTIASFANHPALTGEWRGEPLDSLGPAYAGKVSTAAGRYQLIVPTWAMCKRALGLRDFSPASQDAAATYLIKRRNALDLVQDGRIADAIAACRLEWASLPGAGYGQPERQLATLLDAYSDAGGVIA